MAESTEGSYWQRRLAPPRPAAAPAEGDPPPAADQPAATVVSPPVSTIPDPRSVPIGPSQTAAESPRPAVARRADPINLLPIMRLVTALAILVFAITSYTAAAQTFPKAWLVKWGMLEPITKSRDAYKTEMVITIVLAAVSLVVFLLRLAAEQLFAALLGLYVLCIVTGNILALDASAKAWGSFMTQTDYFITTWIALGLALMSLLSAFWSRATTRGAGGLLLTGSAITGGTVAIMSSFAPTLPFIVLPLR